MENNNLESKKFSLVKIVGPLLGYYIIGVVCQLLYMGVKIPSIIKSFVQNNKELIEIFGEDINNASGIEVYELFFSNLTDEMYMEFIFEGAQYLMDNIGVITVLTGVMVLPFLFRLMKKDNKKMSECEQVGWKYPVKSYLFIAIGSVSLCLGLNCLMMLSGLMEISENYESTATALYNMEFILQIAGLGLIIPLAEEMLYRGVIYRRLKNGFSTKFAIIMSAGIFGMVHGNSVQIIYGFLCGIVFAWLYKEFDSFVAPVIAHMVMNLTSILASNSKVFETIFESNNAISIVAIVGCTITAVCYVMIEQSKINIEI